MYPLKPYNDFKPTSNWNTFYYFKNVFDDFYDVNCNVY